MTKNIKEQWRQFAAWVDGIENDEPVVTPEEKRAAKLAAMTEEEQKAAYGEWHDFVRRCYDAAVKVYPDRAGLETLIDAYRAGEFDISEEPEQEAAE